MLRVTLELIPEGDHSKARVLDSIEIINDQSSLNETHGNYEVRRSLSCRILGRVYAYRRSLGPWELVARILGLGIDMDRNPKL